ncbi:MAG: hypothetical protein R3C28_21730 [Pirellulaceae bacterium]
MSSNGKIGSWLKRILPVRQREWSVLAWAFLWFFNLFTGYYTIRPVRETLATQHLGKELVANLFWAVLVAMLLITPINSALATRLRRQQLMPLVYIFSSVVFLGFWLLLSWWDETKVSAALFFVWVSTFNYFVVSLFWSFMADTFSSEQGRRLFGLIASGATFGGLVGSFLTGTIMKFFPQIALADLCLVPCVTLLLCIPCMRQLDHWGKQFVTAAQTVVTDKPMGGSTWDCFLGVLRSKYLVLICLAVMLSKTCATLAYLQQLDLVHSLIEDERSQTSFFASVNFWSQLVTVVLQTIVVGQVMKYFGVTFALALSPVVYMLGFLVWGLMPSMTVSLLAVFAVSFRALGYGIQVPSQEVLFTVASREDKYKAKNVIDTVISRGADAFTGTFQNGMQKLGAGFLVISLSAVSVAVLWLSVSVMLGRQHVQLRRQTSDSDASVS